MPLNRDFIGRSARSKEPFEVTRNDIRRFALAIGDRNPAYLDPEAAKALGHRDVVAPPTFLISASTGDAGGGFIGDPELGLNYAMVVHGEERFAFHRPVYAGDVLETVTTIADIRDAGRNELMTLVSEVSSNGEPVATVTNTIVSRGTAAPKEA
ncbi:MAG TPA: MaoC family dehydratase N-terminal domain-containing protein [Mycobacteriales bacterium]|jgi:acyl dehydratase|nr:MaoC family dehydratase N-terminal domain-containing protein [Mycobacteriales bacterium]